MARPIYCKGDGTYHYKSDLPQTLRPFVDYRFSSGSITGDDFKSFSKKFKNAIKKMLPEGYAIHSWNNNHYCASGVIKTPENNFIYISISDVRFFPNEWFSDILIRSMKHAEDWTGGPNRRTTLFTFSEDVQKIWR